MLNLCKVLPEYPVSRWAQSTNPLHIAYLPHCWPFGQEFCRLGDIRRSIIRWPAFFVVVWPAFQGIAELSNPVLSVEVTCLLCSFATAIYFFKMDYTTLVKCHAISCMSYYNDKLHWIGTTTNSIEISCLSSLHW
jgi:hypothetical protein